MNRYRLVIVVLLFLFPCTRSFAQCQCGKVVADSVSADSVSSRTLIVFYDATVGKRRLLKAVKKFKGTILYDYKNFNGIAASFSKEVNIDTVMAKLRKVKGVLSVEQDRVLHLDGERSVSIPQ